MSTRSFAEGTSVPVERSRAELETMLSRAGAGQYGVFNNRDEGFAIVAFTMLPKGAEPSSLRQYRVRLPLPKAEAFTKKKIRGYMYHCTAEEQNKLWEQACRERWRALVLATKAKLVLIELGVSSFEHEFLADLALPDGGTLGEAIAPRIAETYQTGSMSNLRLGPGSRLGAEAP